MLLSGQLTDYFGYQMLKNGEPPLKNRILRSPGSLSVPLVPLHPRPDKYKHWTDGQIAKAVDAVRCQGLTVRRAAESYDVPKSTLHDRLSGRVLAGGCSGPPKYLTDEEEEQLEDFLIGSASVGYARSRQQVMQLVGEVVSHKGLASNVTHGWWEGFRKRHPKLTLRTAAPMSYARAMASDPETIGNYFDLLEHTLVENDLLDKPAQIFNMDETGMPLDPSPPRVVARRGQKHPSAVGSGDKSQITVLSCCSAAGYAIPPLVIFDRKSLKTELTTGEVPGTVYGLSKKGWIDGDLFDLWFHKHFLAYAPPVRPLLFLMDGHSSHFQPSVIQRAAEERVIVFCLPPHTTHLTQPLDKGCFGPLKVHWREECWSYICAHPDRIITRYQFSELFGKAWMKAMTMQNIVGGFRTTGVYPFNRSVLIPVKESRRISLAERTGLRFIPLYSPSCRKRAQVPVLSFSTEEIAKFQKRFEEGYDIPDERYDKWIEMYHPKSLAAKSHESDGSRLQFDGSLSQPSTSEGAEDSESDSPSHQSDSSLPLPSTPEGANNACVTLPHTSVLSKLLAQQVPAIKYPDTKPKYSARVLTSLENRLQLEEKERRKKEEAEEKERKKKAREQKRLAVAEEKQRKALERERQRLAREERRKSTTSKKTTQASSSQKGMLISLR